jgi:hypothetical protein
MKSAKIYVFNAFIGDSIYFASQIINNSLTYTNPNANPDTKVLSFVISTTILHSIIMYTFLAWERCALKIKLLSNQCFRYCVIFRPTCTLDKTPVGALKRIGIIWLFALIYSLIERSVKLLPYSFPLQEISLALACLQVFVIYLIPLLIIVRSYWKTFVLLMKQGILETNSSATMVERHRSAKRIILFALMFPVFWLPVHICIIITMTMYPHITGTLVYFTHFSFLFANLNFIICPALLCYICRNKWV